MACGTVLHVQISVSLLRGMLDADDRPEDAMASLRDAIEARGAPRGHARHPGQRLRSGRRDLARRRRTADAAVLLGAVDVVRSAVGALQDRFGAERRERVRSTLIATIPEPELETLSSRGRAMSRDEVRRFALRHVDPLGATVEPA